MARRINQARGGRPRAAARGLAAGAAGLAATAAFLVTAAPSQAQSATARIGAPAPVPAGAARLGALSGSTKLRVDVALTPRDPAALSRYATAVATPGSSLYHRYLARGQFAGRFGASTAAIASVTSALRGLGLRPGAVSSNHLAITVRGTAAQFEQAFGTPLARYRLPGGGIAYANTRAPSLPAAAAAHVQAIIGLDNLAAARPLSAKPSPSAVRGPKTESPAGDPTGGPQPCAQASSAASANGAYTADQLAYSYEFTGLYGAGDFGQGQTVAIVEFGEPNLSSDVNAFQGCYGTDTSVTYYSVDGYHKTGAGEGEAALDIETVISLAPDAHISVFRGPNTGTGSYDVYGSIVAQDKARVVSVSYGLCEHYQSVSLANAVTTLFEQAAVQGQTVVASSGDTGSEGCYDNDHNTSRLSVNFPADNPLVLSVGGTSILNPVPRPGELVWNDGYDGDGAGGGGKSTFYSMPSYQQQFLGVSKGVREVPDVSANADPEDGYMIVYKGHWLAIGGTSAAAPLWAALLALTNEQCSSSPMGWVNPLMYYVASPADPTVVIDDIVTDLPTYADNINNDYFNYASPSGHYPVLAGYDMATGLGTPIGAALAGQLCTYSGESHGYWLATANGNVYAYNAPNNGGLSSKPASKIVGIAGDPATNGYWLVTAKGHVYAFDAPNNGSVTGKLGKPVVGIAADGSTGGYWVVTAGGHVYSFGATGHGSVTGKLGSPVVGIAGDPFTGGYWVVTSGGHVYNFDAGSYPSQKVKTPITGIAGDPLHQGYWLTNASGHVYAFHIGNFGSMPVGGAVGRVVALSPDFGSGGYWLVTGNGHVAALNAIWHGDRAGQSSSNPIVGIASTG